MHIYCDFDGTITLQDTTDKLLEIFGNEECQILEQKWVDGEITAAECMRSQISNLNASQEQIDAILDTLKLRTGFIDFAKWCEREHIKLTIISDGVDYFINRILSRYNLGKIDIYANKLQKLSNNWSLKQPHSHSQCRVGSGVCKCSIIKPMKQQNKIIYIGDGRSDFCASSQADILFARASLAKYANESNKSFIPFETFYDVQSALVEELNTELIPQIA